MLISDEEGGQHLFRGAPYVCVSQLLDKGFPTAEIFSRAASKHTEAEIYYALMGLEKGGYLREAPSLDFPPSIIALLDRFSIPLEEAQMRLQEWPIGFTSFGIDALPEALPYFEGYPFSRGTAPRVTVVFTDSYRRGELLEWSRKAEREQLPWILAKGDGLKGWLGPFFIPGKTACYECLLAALNRNQFEERIAQKEPPAADPIWIPHIRDALFSRLAMEVFQWIVCQADSKLAGTIMTMGWEGDFEMHRVICSCLKNPVHTDWDFSARPIWSCDGGYRSVDPESTWEAYRHLISPLTGVVHSVMGSQIGGAHIYNAFHNRLENGLKEILRAGKYREASCGKGRTQSQAKTGALCEALERISGLLQEDDLRVYGSLEEMGPDAIHPNTLMLFSERQYAMRDSWNRKSHPFSFIPRPFDRREKIDWTPLWSLTHKKKKWLPTAFCYFGYPPVAGKEPFCIGNSNGCAAGNTIEEAILQGLFELIERDAVALWWYSRFQCSKVDLTSFQDPFLNQITSHFEEMGRKIWALDLTSDLLVPTFAVISECENQCVLGFGSHFDANIAISRAMTEMVQSLHQTLDFVVAPAPYLSPNKIVKSRGDYPLDLIEDVKTALLRCVGILEAQGMEVLLLSQTRPEIGLPVIRVVVPGLRHFWNRFAPGRLYDVPYQLGKISRILKEEELNPNPVLF